MSIGLYKSDRKKNWKFEKRRQNEDKHLNFHLYNTLCLPESVHKFHNPNQVVAEKTNEKHPYVLYRSDRRKNWKRRQNELLHLYFLLHNTLSLPEGVHLNLKTLAPIGTEKSATEIFIGEKEKWIKGLIRNMWLFVLLHNTTNHYQALYKISEP